MANPLRRSTSHSNIPRARSSIRLPLPKGPRSSSTDDLRRSIPNQLRQQQSGSTRKTPLFKRSPSINFRSSSSKERLSFLAVGSTGKKYDNRPVNDKNWQKDAWNKVEKYLKQFSFDIQKLKPIQTPSFINLMNMLFKNIDPQIEINKLNYRTEIPKIMMQLNYPSQITEKMLNTLGAPHMFPRFLAIWDWLIDKILLLNDDTPISYEYIHNFQVFTTVVSYFGDLFHNKKTEDELRMELNDAFSSIYNYDSESTESLKMEIEQLEKEKKRLLNELEEMKKDSKERTEKIQEIQLNCESYECKKQNFLLHLKEANKNMLKEIKEKEDKLLQMEEENDRLNLICSKQKYSKADEKNVLEDERSLTEKYDLVQERIKSTAKRLEEHESTVRDLIKKAKDKIYSRNTKLREYSAYEPKLRNLLIREDNLHEEDIFQELATITKEEEVLVNDCKKAIKRCKEKLKDFKLKNVEKDALLKKLNKRQVEEEKCQERLANLHVTMAKKLQNYSDQIVQFRDDLTSIQILPDLKATHEKLLELNERKMILQHEYEEQHELSVHFLSEINKQIYDLIKYSREQYTEFVNTYNTRYGKQPDQ